MVKPKFTRDERKILKYLAEDQEFPIDPEFIGFGNRPRFYKVLGSLVKRGFAFEKREIDQATDYCISPAGIIALGEQ